MNVSSMKNTCYSMSNYEHKIIAYKDARIFESLNAFTGYTCYILSKRDHELSH